MSGYTTAIIAGVTAVTGIASAVDSHNTQKKGRKAAKEEAAANLMRNRDQTVADASALNQADKSGQASTLLTSPSGAAKPMSLGRNTLLGG